MPEHFNYPFFMAEELGLFRKNGVAVDFVIQREGKGQKSSHFEKMLCLALSFGLDLVLISCLDLALIMS